MPHIQIEVNRELNDSQRIGLADRVKALFAEVMDTGTDHIALSIHEHSTYSLDLGRVDDHARGVGLVNADIRQGRGLDQRRRLALGLIAILNEVAVIPPEHVYVTLSEHPGEDFHLNERYLSSWRQGEDPLA